MTSKNEKKLKSHQAKRKKIKVKPDYVIKIIENPKDDGISIGLPVIAADVVWHRRET